MLTRRAFAGSLGLAAAASGAFSEAAYARRAAFDIKIPRDMVWLDSNENPAGPPQACIKAMTEILPFSNRYHYPEFEPFEALVARSEDLSPDQIIVGAGSSENLHAAVEAFTSPTRPVITAVPTYEMVPDVARASGRKVITLPLNDKYVADVRKLAAEADKAGGGMIYLCNPNNPTSSVIPKADISWLVSNQPSNTIVLIDEAYIHFAETPEMESALAYVRQGKNVVVTRTFSKIYGMAGLRAGFAAAPANLIQKMDPFRNNVIACVTMQAVRAALADKNLVPERKATLVRTRRELCSWLRQKNLAYIEPQANFLMIDVKRDTRDFARQMATRGVAVGRPFPPLDHMLRVTIGADAEMAKFRDAFWKVYSA